MAGGRPQNQTSVAAARRSGALGGAYRPRSRRRREVGVRPVPAPPEPLSPIAPASHAGVERREPRWPLTDFPSAAGSKGPPRFLPWHKGRCWPSPNRLFRPGVPLTGRLGNGSPGDGEHGFISGSAAGDPCSSSASRAQAGAE